MSHQRLLRMRNDTKAKLNSKSKELYHTNIGTTSLKDQLNELGFKQRYGRKYKKPSR